MRGSLLFREHWGNFLGSWKLEELAWTRTIVWHLNISGLCVVCIHKHCEIEHAEFLELGELKSKQLRLQNFVCFE